MTSSLPPDHHVHATSIAIGGRAVLIMGPSGSGKSDLALRLIDRGATLVSDDITCLSLEYGRLHAAPPPTIAGKLEIRHIGIVEMTYDSHVPVALAVRLGEKPDRMPDDNAFIDLLGTALPVIRLAGLEPSAPLKLELALKQRGLKGAAR